MTPCVVRPDSRGDYMYHNHLSLHPSISNKPMQRTDTKGKEYRGVAGVRGVPLSRCSTRTNLYGTYAYVSHTHFRTRQKEPPFVQSCVRAWLMQCQEQWSEKFTQSACGIYQRGEGMHQHSLIMGGANCHAQAHTLISINRLNCPL